MRIAGPVVGAVALAACTPPIPIPVTEGKKVEPTETKGATAKPSKTPPPSATPRIFETLKSPTAKPSPSPSPELKTATPLATKEVLLGGKRYGVALTYTIYKPDGKQIEQRYVKDIPPEVQKIIDTAVDSGYTSPENMRNLMRGHQDSFKYADGTPMEWGDHVEIPMTGVAIVAPMAYFGAAYATFDHKYPFLVFGRPVENGFNFFVAKTNRSAADNMSYGKLNPMPATWKNSGRALDKTAEAYSNLMGDLKIDFPEYLKLLDDSFDPEYGAGLVLTDTRMDEDYTATIEALQKGKLLPPQPPSSANKNEYKYPQPHLFTMNASMADIRTPLP